MEKYEFDDDIEYLLRHERGINPNGKSIEGVKPEITETSFIYNFEDINTFLSALDITKSKLYQNQKFLFRGHQDSEWELIPSVFRNLNLDDNKNERLLLKSGNGNHLPELNEFRDFLIGMNQLGLHIDDESFDFINSYKSIKFHLLDYDLFPQKKQLKELALAQHYGIKTRLLDFSKNPYKALFFASEKIPNFKKNEENKKIGIWIIPERLIEIVKHARYLEKVFIQGFQNINMTAQEGLFINYFRGRGNNSNLFNNEGKIKTLDEYIFDKTMEEKPFKLISERIGKPMLFTFPQTYMKDIHEKLDSMNINWYTIQPDLEGVRKEVERKRNIDKIKWE